eukprot:scaffold6468_cov177-Isochrysis_galbana.AAC.2
MANHSLKIQQLPPHPKGLSSLISISNTSPPEDRYHNNWFADQPSSCRFCRKYVESSVHLGRCPSLKKIFGTINKTLGFTPCTNRNIQDKKLVRHAFLFPPQRHPA